MVRENAITLKQLRALTATADLGSLTAAAGILNVTPPAVSTQLRTLEENIGSEILQRGPNGRFSPTAVGQEIVNVTQQIEGALRLSYQRINALKSGSAGHVTLGVVSTAKYFAPQLVAEMQEAHPEIEIGLTVGNRGEIIAALQRQTIELAIMGRPPREPLVEADVLGDHPHVLIAPPKHRLAAVRDISSQVLREEVFLMREEGSGTRAMMSQYLDNLGEGRPYRTIMMGTNETIKQAVMAGLGIAIISAHTVIAEQEAGRLVTLDSPGLPIRRRWFLIRRKGVELSPIAERFRAFLLDLKGEFLPDIRAAGGG